MSINAFEHILGLPIIEKDTITNLCRDGDFSFIKSDKELINFDKLAKKFGNTIYSPDALTEKNSEIYFIEFKNQDNEHLKIKDIIDKLYGGITVFAHFSDSELLTGEIKIKYFILCHQEKNPKFQNKESYNPMIAKGEGFSKALEISGNQITDEDKQNKLNERKQKCRNGVAKKLEYLNLIAQSLSKYSGINIETEIFLFEDERERFINSLPNLDSPISLPKT